MINLRTFSPEFVVNRHSLIRTWQGCLFTICASLLRYNSTLLCRRFFRQLSGLKQDKVRLLLPNLRNFHNTVIMGSSVSRGRKFSPTKNVPEKNPSALVGHAKFNCGDAPQRSTEYVEGVVCKEDDVGENQMKVFDLGDDGGKVLLIKQKGKFSAVGTKCTHYGAPLVNGHLGEGRVRCQWHGACFNIANGDIEDFPGLDCLPCYEVKVANGNVTVRAEKELLLANKRIKPFTSIITPSRATFLVVGGGPAGANCVETLRQQGFDGRLVFVSAEKYLPYDRIKLSKSLDVDTDKIILRSLDFYLQRNVEVMLSTKLSELNPQKRIASLDNGQTLKYDKIFLATGSTPRRLNVPGCQLRNIFVLRTIDDANEIKAALTKTSNVVILGTSFIGMEAAAYCADKCSSVVVIGRDIPFKASFGPVIGNRIIKLYEEKNVQFHLGQTIQQFEGENHQLTTVILSDGTRLPADICLIGIGSVSNTVYLNSAEIELQNGTVEVNEFLQTKYPEVYAGGDIALAPVLGQKASIGHWGLANYHGHIAAFNMLGQKKPLKAVPFFWTVLFGKGFRYTGYTKSFDDVVIDGSVEELKFIAFYLKKDVVVAVATVNRDPLAAKFAEMLYEGKKLMKNNIQNWMS